MYDPEHDDAFEPSGREYTFDDEFIDGVEYVYEDFDGDDYHHDHYYDDYQAAGYNNVVYPDDFAETGETQRFWTRRRIVIVILVILMIGALLYPTAYNIYITVTQPDMPFHNGPTPTALPSV